MPAVPIDAPIIIESGQTLTGCSDGFSTSPFVIGIGVDLDGRKVRPVAVQGAATVATPTEEPTLAPTSSPTEIPAPFPISIPTDTPAPQATKTIQHPAPGGASAQCADGTYRYSAHRQG